MSANAFDLDQLLQTLLAVGSDPGCDLNANVSEATITQLLGAARQVLMKQPLLVEIGAPVTICGDIHGQYFDLLRIFDAAGWPSHTNYLFLGDYVDRGKQNLETMCVLLALKVKYPACFFLLRGNHECRAINRVYGFYDECVRKYSPGLWNTFQGVFDTMPFAALIEGRILCMHGGLPQHLTSLQDIRNFDRPGGMCRPLDPSNPVQIRLLLDLLWADPDPLVSGFAPNARGVSVSFGPDAVYKMCETLGLDLVVRAHQVVQDGYEFFANKRLVTLFSAPHYCGDFDNAAAIMRVDANLGCAFQVFRPSHKKTIQVKQAANK